MTLWRQSDGIGSTHRILNMHQLSVVDSG